MIKLATVNKNKNVNNSKKTAINWEFVINLTSLGDSFISKTGTLFLISFLLLFLVLILPLVIIIKAIIKSLYRTNKYFSFSFKLETPKGTTNKVNNEVIDSLANMSK